MSQDLILKGGSEELPDEDPVLVRSNGGDITPMSINEEEELAEEKVEVLTMERPEYTIPPLGEDWKKELKEEKQDDIPEDCGYCLSKMGKKDRQCKKCKKFRVFAGETIDLSVNPITLPFDVKVRYKEQTSSDRHSIPPPNIWGGGEDMAKSAEMQEYVLNHLPLKEDQKAQLIQQLLSQSKASDRALKLVSERQEEIQTVRDKIRNERRSKKETLELSASGRDSVKGRTCSPCYK